MLEFRPLVTAGRQDGHSSEQQQKSNSEKGKKKYLYIHVCVCVYKDIDVYQYLHTHFFLLYVDMPNDTIPSHKKKGGVGQKVDPLTSFFYFSILFTFSHRR